MTDEQQRPRTTLRTHDGAGVVRIEDVFHTDLDDLWSAITNPERLARWIATVNGDLRLGGEFDAVFTSGWSGRARVEACERPTRLVVALAPATDQATTIEVSLSAVAGGTQLVVEERGLPIGDLGSYGAGWEVHVEDLGVHLEGRTTQQWEPRWRERLAVAEGSSATT